MENLILFVSTFVYIISVSYYLYSIKKIREDLNDKKLEKFINMIFDNEKFVNKLNQIINNSDVSKKIDMLITILCSEDEKLRKTKICK